tara:strand:- start:105 stop:362 length:258 start_codon:yes stop_codon:yes gene_type:complete
MISFGRQPATMCLEDTVLFSSGRTQEEAKEAIWELYKERSEAWNEEGQYLKTIDDLEEWWGVHYRKCKLGNAYFSDHDELTKTTK